MRRLALLMNPKHVLCAIVILAFFSVAHTSSKANALSQIRINNSNFPDANIRKIAKNADTDKNGTLSPGERKKVKKIIINNSSISSFHGIEYFMNIKEFSFSGKITNKNAKSIDLTKNKKLKSIFINEKKSKNNLDSIKLNGLKNLQKLKLEQLSIHSLDASKNNSLKYVLIEGCLSLEKVEFGKVRTLDIRDGFELSDLFVESVVKLHIGACKSLSKEQIGQPHVLRYYQYTGEKSDISLTEYPNLRSVKIYDTELKKLDLHGLENLEKVITESSDLENLNIDRCPAIKSLFLWGWKTPSDEELRLERFPELETISLGDSNIKAVDFSQNHKLKQMIFRWLPLTALNPTYMGGLDRVTVEHCDLLDTIEIGNVDFLELENNSNLKSISATAVNSFADSGNDKLTVYAFEHPESLEWLTYEGEKTTLDVSSYSNLRYLSIFRTKIDTIDLTGTKISKKAIKEGIAELHCDNGINIIYATEENAGKAAGMLEL